MKFNISIILVLLLAFSAGCLSPKPAAESDSSSGSNNEDVAEEANDEDDEDDEDEEVDNSISSANVFFSGHSLININTPRIVEAIALAKDKDHLYNIQIGNGSNMLLRLSTPGNGQDKNGDNLTFSILNEIPNAQTIGGQKYDTLVVTEAIPVYDHFVYATSVTNAKSFYNLIAQSPSFERALLYQGWPYVVGGNYTNFINDIAAQRPIWDCIASKVNNEIAVNGKYMKLIPAAEALSKLVEEIMQSNVPGIAQPSDLFSDDIHLTYLGNYYISLFDFAIIYNQDPTGAPRENILDSWGNTFASIPANTADKLAEIAWDVASAHLALPHPSYTINQCNTLISPLANGNNYQQSIILNALTNE